MPIVVMRIITVPIVVPRIIRIVPQPAAIAVAKIDVHINWLGIGLSFFKILALIIIAEAGYTAFVLPYLNFFDIIRIRRFGVIATVDSGRLRRISFITSKLIVSYIIIGFWIKINVIVIITRQSGC